MAGIVAETVLLRHEPLPVYGTSSYERGWPELFAEQRSDVELIAGDTGYTDPMSCFCDRFKIGHDPAYFADYGDGAFRHDARSMR